MLVQSEQQFFLTKPRASRFEPLNASDTRLASIVEVEQIEEAVEVTQLNAVRLIKQPSGQSAEVERCADVASFQNQDTCDVLPWFERNGDYFLGIYHALRPVESARELFGSRSHFQGILPQLPGGYLLPGSGDAWIEGAVGQICAEKVGAIPIAAPRLLGGGYFTSIGAHTEAAVLVEVEVEPPNACPQMRIGEDFHQSIVSEFLPPQEIIDRFFRGAIPDVRLLEATYRFCISHGIDLKLPVNVSHTALVTSGIDSSRKLQIKSGDQLRSETEQPQSDWRIEQGSADESNDFIRVHSIKWSAKNSQGQVVASTNADVITRGGSEYFLDTVDVGCYFWKDDHLYMVIQRGPREAIGFRNSLAHSIKTDCSIVHNDGISGSILTRDISEKALQNAIAQTVRDKTGCEPLSNAEQVGFYYPSSGFSTEGTYGSLVEIDPHRTNRCENEVFAIELNELLELADQGYIRDVRLAALAHTLSIASGYPRQLTKSHDSEVVEQFNQVLSSGVALQHFLQSKAPDVYAELAKIPEYRRSIAYAINEFGGVVREYESPEERYFFRAAVPLFTYYQSPRDPQEWSLRVLHDTSHFIMGELSPYLHTSDGRLQCDIDGTALLRDQSEFTQWYARSECKAVAISDAVLARNRAAGFSWRARSAEVFSILNVHDAADAFELIEQIELNGKIPKWVLQHPRYLECRDVIVGRLLQFNALDRAQLQIFHRDMVEFPEVAETLARFGRLSTSPQAYADRIENSYEAVVAYGEGVNPVKAQLNAIAYGDLMTAALRIACIERFAKNMPTQQLELILECQALKDRILEVFVETRSVADRMHTIEPNDTRLESYQRVFELKSPVLFEAEQLEEQAISVLPEEVVQLLQQREFPCFHSQKGIDYAAAQRQAQQMELDSFRAAGVAIPKDLPSVEMWG